MSEGFRGADGSYYKLITCDFEQLTTRVDMLDVLGQMSFGLADDALRVTVPHRSSCGMNRLASYGRRSLQTHLRVLVARLAPVGRGARAAIPVLHEGPAEPTDRWWDSSCANVNEWDRPAPSHLNRGRNHKALIQTPCCANVNEWPSRANIRKDKCTGITVMYGELLRIELILTLICQ